MAPLLAVTNLLELSVGDDRERHSYPDHPMRILRDYAHSLTDSMNHRLNVMTAVKKMDRGRQRG